MSKRYCLVSRTLTAGEGGISRVARLMARVLEDEIIHGGVGDGSCLVLNDAGASEFATLSVSGCRGSRAGFAARIGMAQFDHDCFLYSDLSMAQPHAWLPFSRKSVAFVHGIEVWEGARKKYLRCARDVDALVVNSDYTRRRAHDLHGQFERARVCWLGTETDEPPADSPDFTGPPTVLIVGRLQAGRDKGHRALIDAWPKVISKVPDARLAVVGTGNDEQALREYAASAGLGARVDFLGFVPDDRMDRIWNRAWVLAMPSWGEGFGLVYIEAMRFGLPVVASVHDAAPEINLHSHTGFNVDLQRVEELPEVLIRLLNDPQQCAALGQSGHRRWRAHFSYTAFRDRFKPILYEAIN